MSEDINVTDGTVLECLNNKVDLDGGNYVGSPLEQYIHEHCGGGGGGGLEIGDIGIAPLGIDEAQNKRRYINGQLIMQEQFVSFTKKVKEAIELFPSIACTEEEWQATVTMSVFGQCGKFVIDDEAGTIRLPKITGFIQGLTDLASLGELVEAGLPSVSHTHTRGTMNITGTLTNSNGRALMWDNKASVTATGAFTSSGSGNNSNAGTNGTGTNTISFDASKNWTGATSTNSAVPAVYGKSTTVQPEAIRYPYFIQVATGAEESVDVTREIELNNPFFFGYYQYFEVAPNNISWLKSEGQWNYKAVYTDYYDWILINANNGVENFKLSTDTYDDYAWVVNTADETFRLPIKTKNAPFTVNGTANVSVYGNGKTLGLTNGSSDYVLAGGVSGHDTRFANYQSNIDSTSGDPGLTVYGRFGVTTDASKSGLTGKATISTSENISVSLYFYVGETTQNANLVNVGRIEETVVNKLNNKLNRTGDTMTGTLHFQESDTYDVTDLNHTQTTEQSGSIVFYDKNSNKVGSLYNYFNPYNNVVTRIDTQRLVNGVAKSASLSLYVDNLGNANFTFPMCTTKATTTSSATTGRVAAVVQNYVSGTSWYRVWSDGWIEQGGSSAFSSKNTATITFAKKFASTPTINISGTFNEIAEIEVNALTASNFTWILNTSRTGTVYYYACGY